MNQEESWTDGILDGCFSNRSNLNWAALICPRWLWHIDSTLHNYLMKLVENLSNDPLFLPSPSIYLLVLSNMFQVILSLHLSLSVVGPFQGTKLVALSSAINYVDFPSKLFVESLFFSVPSTSVKILRTFLSYYTNCICWSCSTWLSPILVLPSRVSIILYIFLSVCNNHILGDYSPLCRELCFVNGKRASSKDIRLHSGDCRSVLLLSRCKILSMIAQGLDWLF